GIGDFDGLLSITPKKINFHPIRLLDASDVKLPHEYGNPFCSTLGFWLGFGIFPPETDKQFVKTSKHFLKQSVAGMDEFGVLGEAQLFDYIRCNVLRFQDAKLTFDPSGISRWIARQGLR